ncbi:hypothetical protein [Flyfo microvirus Tbat1_59]|nr:hypothetical protein [Flyfo microvirus Tbat1_59]
MRKFRNTASALSSPGEKGFSESTTVPDQALTMREILTKYVQGTFTPQQVQPSIELEYSDDLPDLRGMDMVQMSEMNLNTRTDIDNLENTQKQQQIKLAEAKSKSKKQQSPEPLSPDEAFDAPDT